MKGGRAVSHKHLSTFLVGHGPLPEIHHGAPTLHAMPERLPWTYNA